MKHLWLPVIVLAVVGLFALIVFSSPISSATTTVEELDTRKGSMYETPTEKLVTLSDGRKMVCLQASYGALWCTPALTDLK